MNIHDLFEQHISDVLDIPAEAVKLQRLTNGSYSHPRYATAFRMFRAGFEANQAEKLQVLGYLGKEYAKPMTEDEQLYLSPTPTEWETEPVFIKQCDSHKTGE